MYHQPRAFLLLYNYAPHLSNINVGGVVLELIFVVNLFIILIFHLNLIMKME